MNFPFKFEGWKMQHLTCILNITWYYVLQIVLTKLILAMNVFLSTWHVWDGEVNVDADHKQRKQHRENLGDQTVLEISHDPKIVIL